MIADFEDFCLWMYVVVAELWCQLPPAYKRRSGPPPACSDSELLTLAPIGECRGWTTETTLPGQWAAYRLCWLKTHPGPFHRSCLRS